MELIYDDDSQDKAVRACSKALYRTLNPGGKQQLEVDEVLQNISKAGGISNDEATRKKKELVERAIKKIVRSKGGKGLNEKDLEKVNLRFKNGKLPRLKSVDVDESEDTDANKISNTEKSVKMLVLKHIISSTMYIWKLAEKAVSRTGRTWMWTLLPTGQISTLLSFLLFSYVIRSSFLTWFIPLALLSVSILVMVVSTIRIVRGKGRFNEFAAWGEFLDLISEQEEKTIDTGKAQETYIVKHVSPNVHFLLATVSCVMGFGTSDKSWVLVSEFCILSLVMYGIVVQVFNLHAIPTARNVLICQIFSYVFRGFQCGDADQIFGLLVSFPIPVINGRFNVSFSSVFRIIMAVQLFIYTYYRDRDVKLNIHVIKHVLPVVIAIVWWDVADLFFCNSNLTSIARASLECMTLLFAMPLFVVLMSYAFFSAILSIGLTKFGVTLSAIILSIVYFAFRHSQGDFVKKLTAVYEKSSLKRVASLVIFTILGYVMLHYRPAGLQVKKSGLSWNDYRDLCIDPIQIVDGNRIFTDASCYEFRGYGVTWAGEIEGIRVTNIENKMGDLLNLLPKSIASWLSCKYGNPYPSKEYCSKYDTLSPFDISLCKLSDVVAQSCSIQNHNIYEFEIEVKMPLRDGRSSNLALKLRNDFRDMLFGLTKGTPVQFSGTITDEKGALSVHAFYSNEGGDIIKAENRVRGITRTLGDMLDDAFASLYSFIVYPIISLDISK